MVAAAPAVPALSDENLRPPLTATGTVLFAVEALPSCPCHPAPQQYAVPVAVSAQEKEPPELTEANVRPPATGADHGSAMALVGGSKYSLDDFVAVGHMRRRTVGVNRDGGFVPGVSHRVDDVFPEAACLSSDVTELDEGSIEVDDAFGHGPCDDPHAAG